MKSAIILFSVIVILSVLGANGELISNQMVYSSSDNNGQLEAVHKVTFVQQLEDGTCVRKTEETKNGETQTTTEQVDCAKVQQEQTQTAQEVEDQVSQMQDQIQAQIDAMEF